MDVFEVICQAPTPDEFIRLRESVGWFVPERDAAGVALANSIFSVCVLRRGECVGCGRVVGDGCLVFHVQDVMVLPECQRQGCGGRIMDALMEYINGTAQLTAFIALFSAPGLESWYTRYGFVPRPTQDRGPGMAFFKI
jgi:GNAT superfamily N-acetyltransferase